MIEGTKSLTEGPGTPRDTLNELLREGAQRLLAQAIEAEVAAYIEEHKDERDEHGRRLVVRNGRKPRRRIGTGVGEIEVEQPRVNDRRADEDGDRIRFQSKILPPYLRRTKAIDDLVPWLYLKGVSTNDFPEFLRKIVGTDATGLSPTTVVRLKEAWTKEYETWRTRSLEGKRYVYMWADGVHFNIRLDEGRQCVLVLMGATEDGKKELIAVYDGYRESEQSWLEILRELTARGLRHGPELAIGDGALGFWKALGKVFPHAGQQRCWVHKTANVLNKMPKTKQSAAKADLHEIWMAATREEAEKAFDLFSSKYADKYRSAVECLAKDRDELLAFYDFPAEHWVHLRTTNPIESTFATVRLRTKKTKGSGSRNASLAMVFKLAQAAAKNWRRLTGAVLIKDVIYGVKFKDGIKVAA